MSSLTSVTERTDSATIRMAQAVAHTVLILSNNGGIRNQQAYCLAVSACNRFRIIFGEARRLREQGNLQEAQAHLCSRFCSLSSYRQVRMALLFGV